MQSCWLQLLKISSKSGCCQHSAAFVADAVRSRYSRNVTENSTQATVKLYRLDGHEETAAVSMFMSVMNGPRSTADTLYTSLAVHMSELSYIFACMSEASHQRNCSWHVHAVAFLL